jgi:polar amino acid transport system substrate-binding protein
VRIRTPIALLSVALLLAACGGPLSSALPSREPSGAPSASATQAASEAPSVEPTAAPTKEATTEPTTEATVEPTAATTAEPTEAVTAPPASAGPPTELPATALPSPLSVCGPIESLSTKTPGRLTLSTDIPAYPPWWGGDASQQYPNEPAGGDEWSQQSFSGDPYSMEGFEGATAYAIANAMGFTPDLIDWVPNSVFEQSFAPGPKQFDFHMAQVSIRPKRALAVDFSDPYFDANQAVLALADNSITSAQNINDLKSHELGAAANTTSFDLIDQVIQPTVEPRVYPDNATALTALKNGQIDGLVVDLGTAFYMRDAQLAGNPEGKIVGQFSTALQADQVGAVLQKNSPLTPCVDLAIQTLKANGTLQAIYDQWIVTGQEIPFLQ